MKGNERRGGKEMKMKITRQENRKGELRKRQDERRKFEQGR